MYNTNITDQPVGRNMNSYGGNLQVNKRYKSYYLLVCILLVLLATLTGCSKKAETVKDTAITVNTAQAKTSAISRTVTYSGIVRGKNEVYIMPKVSARVTGIYVKPGDQVRQGQTLITLDSSDYDAAIRRAQASLQLAQAGQRTNELGLNQARDNYERILALHQAGGISDQALETAKNAYESLAAGTVEASVAQAQAGVLEVRKQIENCTITSPINGVVGSINLSLGDNTSMSQVAAIVGNGGDLEIELQVGEGEVSYIQRGSEVAVSINAVPDQQFKGKVDSISTVADPSKRSYTVKVALPNIDGKVKSGMFAEINVDTIHKDGVLCVPVGAVVPKEGSNVVYIVDKDKRARSVTVTTGIRNNKYVEITKGLTDGQEVITKGNTLVNEGTLVKVVTGGAK